jgi:hypothetical protein
VLLAGRVLQQDREIHAAVGDEREGVLRIVGERRTDREYQLLEIPRERRALGIVEQRVVPHADPLRRQGGQQLLRDQTTVPGQHGAQRVPDGGKLLRGGPTVR